MASKKKSAAFVATNVEDVTDKPAPVAALWHLLSKMDPEGDLFVSDKGLIAVDGEVATTSPKRTIPALGLSPIEAEWVRSYAIYDSSAPDEQESATGLLFTMYQMLELAFSMGVQSEAARVTSAIVRAASPSDDDDADADDEDLDDEPLADEGDDEMDSVVDDDDDDDTADNDDDDDDDA